MYICTYVYGCMCIYIYIYRGLVVELPRKGCPNNGEPDEQIGN